MNKDSRDQVLRTCQTRATESIKTKAKQKIAEALFKKKSRINQGTKACNTGWRANLAKPPDVLNSFVVVTIWTLVRTGASRQLGV